MRRPLHKLLLMSLLAAGLQGCVTNYYPAPVIYTDPLADNSNPVSEETGVPSEVLPYTDFGAEVASAQYYPYWSLDYFYLGYGYGHSSFSIGFGRHYPYYGYGYGSYYPYHGYYYEPPYRHGWYAPYWHDHNYHRYWNAGYWPYWHHYWRHQYRRHHYAYHPRYHDRPYGQSRHADTLDPRRNGRRYGERAREDHEVPRLSTPVVSSGLAWDAPSAGHRSGATPGKTKGNAKSSFLHSSAPGGKAKTKVKTPGTQPVRVISRSTGYGSSDSRPKAKPAAPPVRGTSRTQPVGTPGRMENGAIKPAVRSVGTLSVVSSRSRPAPTQSPGYSVKSKSPTHRTHSAVAQPRMPAMQVNAKPRMPSTYGQAPNRPPAVKVPSRQINASQSHSSRQLRGATPASSRKRSGNVRTSPPRSRTSQSQSDRDR